MKESQSCKYSEKPPTFRACNVQSCSEMSSTTQPHADPRVDLIQNDSSCRDDFPNCNIVMRARLCSYAYYNEHCCQTCRTKSNELYQQVIFILVVIILLALEKLPVDETNKCPIPYICHSPRNGNEKLFIFLLIQYLNKFIFNVSNL